MKKLYAFIAIPDGEKYELKRYEEDGFVTYETLDIQSCTHFHMNAIKYLQIMKQSEKWRKIRTHLSTFRQLFSFMTFQMLQHQL